ncbi:MAG: AAA family ATPase [Anaerolineales bacterium]|nr:AAA family ATPase [Anaerolineales bacterium]
MEKEDELLIQLTERRFSLLNFLASRRRALIAGCAGSGKTMLAVEKARQLHEQGFSVLLTCFNSALAEDLSKRLPEVTVLHFHGLCRELAKETGFTIQMVKDQQELYDITLPEILMKAVDTTGPMFDAIIVDERQDFLETFWVALTSLLKEKEGIFFVFFDDNQNLYGGASLKGIVNDEPFLLSENCRNTKAIHKVVSSFYSDGNRIICNCPEGRTPELHFYLDTVGMLTGIRSILNKLINEEYIATDDIVILTPYGQKTTELKIGARLGNFTLTDNQPRRRNEIQTTTIHKFKGLERKVVIIAEVDDKFKYNPETLMYVGSSRARTHLLFFVHQNASIEIKSRIETACKPN